ncbi:MAG: ABC transporter ATP-binding protein/permease [Actinobacteria bacterium]|nr:ABC transporter ATP-binding protein/permease [Actinomycetota bacterium]
MSQRGKDEGGPPIDRRWEDVNPWEREDSRLGPRRLLGLVRASLRLVWRASPSETINLLVLQTLSGLALPVQVLAAKGALDSIFDASRSNGGMEDALPALAVALAAMTAGQIVAATARHRQRLLPELAGQAAQEMLAEKAAAIDLEALETPAFHNRLNRAQNEASFRPANMVADMARIVSSTVAVVGLAGLLLTVHPLLVAGLLAAMLPLSWASVAGGRAYYRYAVRRTPKRRLIGYLQGLLSQLDSGKEIRAFALGPYLLEHRQRLFDEEMADLRKLIRGRLRRDVLATLASSAVVAGGVVFILWLHFSQRISLAETIAAAGALLLMLPRMNMLTGAVGQLHENALFVEDLWSFVAVESRQRTPDSPAAMPATLAAVRVDDVTFRYRDGAAPVLRGVSIEIRLGETVAVVGENGAGKTTLAKLLCRLYDPESGTITWDGRDLRTCDPYDLRTRIAVVFQDFVRYDLSARENIGFGDVDAIENAAAIAEAARRAGAADFLTRLPDGYETRLGRRFLDGHDLSIGQWQRVALARVFFRDAPLVIMDEPTASLDARSEHELFKTMRGLFDDRAVLLISHRFSSVRMADRIYVLRDGAVVEVGTHDELIASDGLYAELFGLQAASYVQRPD